ncbi:MAG: hypothetical protein AAGB34_03025, partial [Planctomycetota bacterium]
MTNVILGIGLAGHADRGSGGPGEEERNVLYLAETFGGEVVEVTPVRLNVSQHEEIIKGVIRDWVERAFSVRTLEVATLERQMIAAEELLVGQALRRVQEFWYAENPVERVVAEDFTEVTVEGVSVLPSPTGESDGFVVRFL